MFVKETLLLLTLWATYVLALDFTNAKWIWTNETGITLQAPSGSRAFRRDYQAPAGKSALSASVLIAADDAYTLYVNGQQIGAGSNSSASQVYCVSLSPSFNVFAVNVTNAFNVPNPATNSAGLLSAIQIQYTDGSVDKIVTDSSWRATPHVPAGFPVGFQLLGYNDTTWPAATVEASYGDAPWGVISIPSSTSSRPLSLTDANWIWTNEVRGGNAPLGTRAFRKTFTLPAGQFATSATIYMDADNEFTLYVQGKIVGSGTNWEIPQKFIVNLPPDSSSQVITIAVFTRNDDGPTSPAGLIAAVDLTVQNTDCGTAGPSFVTDGTWKFNVGTPVGFQQVGYADSAWPLAVVEGKYGVSPWGGVPVPAAVSGSTGPIAGAPSA